MAAGETLTRPAWQERGVVAPIAVHCEEGHAAADSSALPATFSMAVSCLSPAP